MLCHDGGVTAIELHDIVKTFGPVKALDGLHLTVEPGEVHGFLGPNGAGKSTTIRVLLGLLKADAGSATLLGGDPWRQAAELHRRIVYVPGDVNLWPNLTGGEVIDVLGRMRGGLDEKRRAEMLERFELDPRKKARTYSKGNRQKVALVAALASRAELYLLDEPTSGLDPLMEAEFQRAVLELKHEGATVLLSSPHPGRGGGAVRPDQHHPSRPGRPERLARRAAASDPHDGHRRDGEAGHRHRRGRGRAQPAVPRRARHLRRRLRSPRRRGALTRRSRRTLAGRPPPDLEELFLRQYGEEVTA